MHAGSSSSWFCKLIDVDLGRVYILTRGDRMKVVTHSSCSVRPDLKHALLFQDVKGVLPSGKLLSMISLDVVLFD